MFKFALGQAAVMTVNGVTGVTGVVASHSVYLNGSRQYGIYFLDDKGVIHQTTVPEYLLEPVQGETEQDIPYGFSIELGETVRLPGSGKQGNVNGAHRVHGGQTQYLVMFDHGAPVEDWFEESLLA